VIAHVIDDLFDMQFLADLEDTILETPVYSTNVANPASFPHGRTGSHRLFGADIFVRHGLNRVETLHKEANKFFDAFAIIEQEVFNCPIFLRRIDLNLQYYGQDGSAHTDGVEDNDWTIMIMSNTKWKPEWGGQFQLLEGDKVVEQHDYVPGRLVIFPGNVLHRGLAPLDRYAYRYTTVFRVVIDDFEGIQSNWD
jgi:hypothetical protein